MNITKFAIDNSRVTYTLFFAIVLFGIVTFLNMPRAYDPGFIIRTAQIVTYLPGASPERVEELVSSQIEDTVKDISELDFVTSESRTGTSIVLVNIKESYKEMRPIWDNLRRKIADVESDLPDGVIGPFVNDEFGDVFGIVLTMTGEGYNFTEMEDISDEIKADLLRLPDAAKVEVYGEQEQRIFVEYDNARLAELGISPNQLSSILQARNIVISGGAFTLGYERIALEPSGNFEFLADIGKTIIQLNGHSLYLRDIAKITHAYVDPPESMVKSSGKSALAFAVSMREGGNNIKLGEQVLNAVKTFNNTYPHGIEFDLVNFMPAEVDTKVKDFVNNLAQAIAIVTLVMLATLGIRTGLIIASLIPTAILFALIIMQSFSIGLDQISLAALIIALGMLVDNGIVISENIMVRMGKGESAVDAATHSAAEMKIPLLVASLTTSAAFLPIYLAESSVGEFTAALFTVVSITLLCSWLISLTIIPMFCVKFLKIKPQDSDASESPFYQQYGKLLTVLLRHKWITLGVTSVIFVGVMSLMQYLPSLFFPPSDRLYFKAAIELPTGTSIRKMEDTVTDIESFVQSNLLQDDESDGVTNWVSYIGNAGPRFLLSHNPKPNNTNYSMMIINVSNSDVIAKTMEMMKDYCMKNHPDVDITLRRIENGPAVENPVEVRLMGKDKKQLFEVAGSLKQKMFELGGMLNISDDWGQRIKKLNIQVDQARALRTGVTSQDIAVSLQASLSGLQLTEFRDDEDIIPIMLRSNVATENEISKLESLSVYAQSSGKSVPLRQVADINLVWDEAKILRRGGLKTVTIGAQLASDNVTAEEKFVQLAPWLEEIGKSTQGNIRFEYGGERESSGDANQSIKDKLGIAGLIILVLLIAQFNSIRKASIVLFTIPLGLIGVVIGLLVAKSYFGFMTFLGIVSLAGIVINNAIVLLERIQIELDEGAEHGNAIVEAAKTRARPILLTTATTVLGMLPLYLGGGAMWEPLAIAIMAGLLFSTVLTLSVVPALYAAMFRVKIP